MNRSITTRKEILNSNDTALINTYNHWIEIKQVLSSSFRDLDFQGSYWNIADLETQANKLEQSLKSKTQLFSNKSSDYKEIQKKLKPGEAAINIFRSYTTINDTASNVEYLALLLKKDSPAPQLIKLNRSKNFEGDYIAYYSERMEEKKEDKLSYDRFWKPIAAHLTGINKIYLSAEGTYNKLNLYTLQDPATNKYVIDDLSVCILPNLSYLLDNNKGNTKNTAELFGYPDYEYDFSKKESKPFAAGPALALNRFGFSELPPLPGTETEINNISGSLTKAGWQVETFSKAAASEEQLKKVVSPKVLHIATHGFFLKNVMDNDDKSILGFESTKIKMNPLLRSGIMMAGASVVARDTANKGEFKQDGIFTAYEASLLNLTNTDLVVLSACETGLGVDVNNQGVFGLQRAFYIAGAKNLIMSLWVVDDDATQILMSRFYKEWSIDPSKENIAKAFKKAQLEVRKKYPHPYYWGAFTLLGN
jgi:CHAT domain-containing protein